MLVVKVMKSQSSRRLGNINNYHNRWNFVWIRNIVICIAVVELLRCTTNTITMTTATKVDAFQMSVFLSSSILVPQRQQQQQPKQHNHQRIPLLFVRMATQQQRGEVEAIKSSSSNPSSNGSNSSSNSNSNSIVKFKDLDSLIQQYQKEPILLYFSSNTCSSCTIQKQQLLTIRNTIRQMGSVPYTKHLFMINTDQFPHINFLHTYNITKLPCIIVMQQQEIIVRFDGFTSADDLLQQFYTLASSSSSASSYSSSSSSSASSLSSSLSSTSTS